MFIETYSNEQAIAVGKAIQYIAELTESAEIKIGVEQDCSITVYDFEENAKASIAMDGSSSLSTN